MGFSLRIFMYSLDLLFSDDLNVWVGLAKLAAV